MQKDSATCPDCRSAPGPKEIYIHKDVEEEDDDGGDDALQMTMTPLADLMRIHSESAVNWFMELPVSEMFTAKFEEPTFMPRLNAMLPTIDIEEKISFSGGGMISPLCYATSLEFCEDAVSSLIHHGANLKSLGVFSECNCCANGEETMENALFGACIVVSAACVKAVLATGVSPNIVDASGKTPLMRCLDVENVNNWRMDIVNMLLESGAKVSHRDSSGKNVFHVMMGPWVSMRLSKDGFTPVQLQDLLMEAYLAESKK